MEPVTVISTALAIAEASGLSGWLGRKLGGDIGERTAETITDIAGRITNVDEPEEILEVLRKDKVLAGELKQLIIANEHELKIAYLRDVESARDMYKSTDHKQADKIADSITKWNTLIVFCLICVNIAVVVFIPDPTLVALVSNMIGASISYLWNERSTVINFFYGSSQGSKDKSRELLVHTERMKELNKKMQ